MLKNGCRQSVIDPALFIYEVHGRLEGLIATHVDDLLSCGSPAMTRLLAKVDTEFGFGSREYDDFRHTGKRVRKVMDPQANETAGIFIDDVTISSGCAPKPCVDDASCDDGQFCCMRLWVPNLRSHATLRGLERQLPGSGCPR